MILMDKLNELTGQASPLRLEDDLRKDRSDALKRRRTVVALNLAAIGSMAAIAMYQTGLVDHLPEPPLKFLDADRVDASREAYEKLHTPDAVLGLRSYATTLVLATMGGDDRARARPWIPIALALKATADAVQAGKLTWDQWAKHKAFCSYCLLAAGATIAALPLTFPEAREALRELRQRAD